MTFLTYKDFLLSGKMNKIVKAFKYNGDWKLASNSCLCDKITNRCYNLVNQKLSCEECFLYGDPFSLTKEAKKYILKYDKSTPTLNIFVKSTIFLIEEE